MLERGAVVRVQIGKKNDDGCLLTTSALVSAGQPTETAPRVR